MYKKISLLALLFWQGVAHSQNPIMLNDLSAFDSKSSEWQIVSDVSVDLNQKNSLSTTPGKGVLACLHNNGKYGFEYDLSSKFSHGDLDLEFDFLLAKGSNSGVYLQGKYEIQLYDSWGVKNAKYYDCGGIYQRWNDNKPENEKGYEGYAPRTNQSKSAGLWQNMKISFQAPRFDASGKKITNAKFLYVKLNGITIHENVEMSGVTRGSDSETEVALAPFRIQGDHGSIAFRNMVVNNFDKMAGKISDLTYKTYYGVYSHDADLSTLKIDERGKTDDLTWEVTKNQNDYVFLIKGKYIAPTDGKYVFYTQIGGNSSLKIDGKEIIKNEWTLSSQTREASIDLKAGEHSFEIFNNKRDGWLKPALGFWSSGPGFRAFPHHSIGSLIASKPSDPIILSANNNVTLRSFMDFKKPADTKSFRIVHAISVGSPENLHYTYDLDKGAIVQVWRGLFLDATPMWNDRGDGSSLPLGSVNLLNHDLLLSNNSTSAWPKDTTGTGFKPLGYTLDEQDLPTFSYKVYGSKIQDKIRVVEGNLISREISLDQNLVARIAEGSQIVKVNDKLFVIDDKSYFIKIDSGTNAVIRDSNGKKELLLSAADKKISYSILF
jgi:hypothetical protein